MSMNFTAPRCAWHFDVGNSINNGWPEQWIRILGGRIHKLHIKEYSRKKRDQEGLWKGFEVGVSGRRQRLARRDEGAGRNGLQGMGHGGTGLLAQGSRFADAPEPDFGKAGRNFCAVIFRHEPDVIIS